MTRFLGDAIGSRDGKGKIDRKRDLEEFKRTGRHPEIEAAREAAASAAATAAPLPARDPSRRHVFLDLALPSASPSAGLDFDFVRLVVEVFDDLDRAAGGALLARCDGSGGSGAAAAAPAAGLLSGGAGAGSAGALAGARLSRASAGQGLFFAAPRGGPEPFSPSSSRPVSGQAPPLLHHTEAGAVSLSRAALLSGGNAGRAGGGSGSSSAPPLLAVLLHPCGPLDSTYAVAGRVVPQCLPTLERLEGMAREDSEKAAPRGRRATLASSAEVAAAGRATPRQAASLTAAELDAEAVRDARGRREAARAAASPAAAAARAEAEAAAARGAVEEALAVSAAAAAEAREHGADGGKGGGGAAAPAPNKRRKKGGMLDTVLGGGDGGDDDSDSDSDSDGEGE